MTHAALKDQKARAVVWTNNCTCHPETCCCPPFKVKVDGKYLIAGTEEACATVAAAINAAALSAMEGEAVAWMVERDSDPSFPRLMRAEAEADSLIFYCNVSPPVTKRPLIYGDTAPPPQQAAERSKLLALADEISEFGDTLDYSRQNARATEFAVRLRALATQPQQAGGDALRRGVQSLLNLYSTDEVSDEPQTQHDLGYEQACAEFAQHLSELLSTPPQPEAGGGEEGPRWWRDYLTDKNAEAAAKRAISARNEYLALNPGDAVGAMKAAITGALSTTTASGGEHG